MFCIGTFLCIAIENLFPPIPSEIILGSAGFLCALGHMNFFLTILCSLCASLLGAYLLYKIGSRFDRDSLLFYLSHQGKWMHIPTTHVEKAFDAFSKHGSISVFFLRFVPIIRSLISIPAGMSHMNLTQFLSLSGIASCLWNTFIIGIGYYTQDNYEMILNQLSFYFKEIILILFFILILIIISYSVIRRFKIIKK